jgi:hypothetical protein
MARGVVKASLKFPLAMVRIPLVCHFEYKDLEEK